MLSVVGLVAEQPSSGKRSLNLFVYFLLVCVLFKEFCVHISYLTDRTNKIDISMLLSGYTPAAAVVVVQA